MMEKKPNRQSIRLRDFNYAGPGTFFVTVCTGNCKYSFGQVIGGAMQKSPLGLIAEVEWKVSLDRRPFIIPHAFVVMPNHVHGLVSFDPRSVTPADSAASTRRLQPASLGAFLNRYKGAVTVAVRGLLGDSEYELWQRNYYERVVRNQAEFDSVLSYIEDNPARWQEDRFNIGP